MGPTDSDADDELLARTARHPAAFAVFYRRYADNVFAFFFTRTSNAEIAADLTAETFAAALRSAARYRGTAAGNAGPWLFTIAHRTLVTSLRRKRVDDKARRRLGMEPVALDDEELERVVARLDLAEHEAWLAELLGGLPSEQRAAILAHVVDERPYAEIAAHLGCSESVVRQRVSRGLRSLRAQISEPRP